MRILLALLIAVSAFCLALGVTQPLLRFERLIFFTSTPSLIEMITQLWSDGDRLLGAVVALFSIVFPAGKILAVQAVMAQGGDNPARRQRMHRFLGIVSKWSMMDVLVVALVIVAAKTSGLADAFTQPGLWFYSASVATAAVATALAK